MTRLSVPTSASTSAGSSVGTIAVLVSAIGFGLSPTLATYAFAAGIEPTAASFLRIALLGVVLSPFARSVREWKRESIIMATGGAVSMLGFAGYFVALDRAPIAAATVVYYTYPVMVLLISAALWKRPLRRTEVVVCTTIVAGVALCVGPMALSGDVMVALLPAFAAPVGWAIFLIVLSGPVGAMPTLPKMFAGSCGGAIALLPIAIWRTGGALMPLTAPALSAMALLTLCTLAIPGILVSWGAARAGDRATAMIGSLEFVVALGVSWILTGASLDRLQLVGIAGIVLAAAVGSRTANGETVLNSTDGGGAHNASDDREEVPLLAGVCDRSVGRAAACS